MIEVHICGAEHAAEVIEQYGFSAGSIVLAASENGDEVGFVALRMNYGPDIAEAELTGLCCPGGDADVSELLVRAAVSCAERRGALSASAPETLDKTALLRAGFRLSDGAMRTEVGNVVHICRNCAAGDK